jgi:hypothetical protein
MYRFNVLQLFSVFAILAGTSLAGIPATFEPNLGQEDSSAVFIARTAAARMHIDPRGFSILRRGGSARVSFNRASDAARIRGDLPTGGTASYMRGPRERWIQGVPLYGGVTISDVYPHIDISFHAHAEDLEYDFVLRPGADVSRLSLSFAGAQSIRVESGDLVLTTASGVYRHHSLRIYQERAGTRSMVPGRFVIRGKNDVGFEVEEYDHQRDLVIDPVLTYSTYLGGSSADSAWAVAVDSSGAAYIAGETSSYDFPHTAAASTWNGNPEAFVVKLNPAGTSIAYAMYFGGSLRTSARSLAVDAAGNAYVAGFTYASDFPATPGAYRSSPLGTINAFLVKLNAAGTALVYSTLFGGYGTSQALAVAVDASGDAYIAGSTSSATFPVTAGCMQHSNGGGAQDAFVLKLNPAGSALIYSSYMGGGGNDYATSIAIDATGSAYLAGYTDSPNLPVQAALNASPSGGGDAFIARLNTTGTALIFGTYLGGSMSDAATHIALDASGNIFVAGYTDSYDFPVTANALQSANAGFYDAFVLELNPQGNALVYSTYLGGQNADQALGLAVSPAGVAYVTGATSSPNFPAVNTLQAQQGGGDAFIAAISPGGSSLLWSTYIGGGGSDQGTAIALGADLSLYVVGSTSSNNFSVTGGALQGTYAGQGDAFVLKLSAGSASASAGDFDGNGTTDLVWQNDSTRTVGVWYMGGLDSLNLLFTDYPAPGSYPGWTLVAVADMDGNGVPDLVWQNDGTRSVGVWYMGGAHGTSLLSVSYPAPGTYPGWTLVSVHDMNGDGIPDLVWQNDSTRAVGVWFMSGPGATQLLGVGYPAPGSYPGWTLVGVADFDRNGYPDLVWQNDSTGAVGVWYLGANFSLQSVGWPSPGGQHWVEDHCGYGSRQQWRSRSGVAKHHHASCSNLVYVRADRHNFVEYRFPGSGILRWMASAGAEVISSAEP